MAEIESRLQRQAQAYARHPQQMLAIALAACAGADSPPRRMPFGVARF